MTERDTETPTVEYLKRQLKSADSETRINAIIDLGKEGSRVAIKPASCQNKS